MQPTRELPELVLDLPAAQSRASGEGGKVGFTVINYNTAAQTLRCIASLGRCIETPEWILVLDNASAKADFEALRDDLERAPSNHIQLFRSTVNLGFAAGSNFLIDQLLVKNACAFIGLLNNDAVAMPEMIRLLRQALTPLTDSGSIGMSGGRMHKLHDPQTVDTLGDRKSVV